MGMFMRRFPGLASATPTNRRWIPVALDFVDKDDRSWRGNTLQRRPFTHGALRQELEAELQAVWNKALPHTDAHNHALDSTFPGDVGDHTQEAFRAAKLLHRA